MFKTSAYRKQQQEVRRLQFVECDCHCHAICIEMDPRYDCESISFSIWYMGEEHKWGWWRRLHILWRIIRHGHPYLDSIALRADQMLHFAQMIQQNAQVLAQINSDFEKYQSEGGEAYYSDWFDANYETYLPLWKAIGGK